MREIMYKPSKTAKIRGAAKKTVIFLMAGPRGGGVKALPLRKKNFFCDFFLILLPFKHKSYFTLDNLSKYIPR